MNNRDYAVRIFKHYFQLLAERAGINLNNDCMIEIEGAVDSIIEAAKESEDKQ